MKSAHGLLQVFVPACAVLLCLLAGCSSKKNPGKATVAPEADSTDWSGTGDQFNGKFILRDGRLSTMSNYTGTITILDAEARKVSVESYKEGLRQGGSIRWWENGNKKLEMTYVDGKSSGPTFEWFLDGKKKVEKEYSSGIPHGKEVAWYDDGAKHYERHYSGGKPHGIWTDWDRGGHIVRQIEYENGKAVKQLVP